MREEEEPEEEEEDELGHAETYAEYMPMKCTCWCSDPWFLLEAPGGSVDDLCSLLQ